MTQGHVPMIDPDIATYTDIRIVVVIPDVDEPVWSTLGILHFQFALVVMIETTQYPVLDCIPLRLLFRDVLVSVSCANTFWMNQYDFMDKKGLRQPCVGHSWSFMYRFALVLFAYSSRGIK